MSRRVTVVYDDRAAPPAGIDAIVGAARYSEVLRRRVSLGETVRRASVAGGAAELVHLLDEQDARVLAEGIEAGPADRVFLHLPSCLMPTREGALAAEVAKGRFAMESLLLAPPFGDVAAGLLSPRDAVSLLRARDAGARREVVLRLAAANPSMLDPCGLADLRRPEAFLRFMGDATEARHFNTTERSGAVFRKSSADREKMAREHGFFHVAPERMKAFLQPTFDFADDGTTAGYSTERLHVPDAALQFIHRAFDPASFSVLLDRFFAFLAARPTRADGVAAVRDRARAEILGKMRARLDALLDTAEGRRLDAVLGAAGPCGDLRAMQARAERLIEAAIGRDGSAAVAVGHGDPCFSNILFDRRIGLLRLVDPRGARTLEEAWMHPLYDLAKFTHSALGGYDFVNNDPFECALDEGLRLALSLHDGGPPTWCRDAVRDRLGGELFVVRAYELSLFMSMLPLHRDHPRKLSGFALIACGLIEELERMA